jgi:hypothetical protein
MVLAKMLIVSGIFLAAAGLVVYAASRVPGFGRLPGDILIERGRFTFYFPLATCLLASLILTLILNLFKRS